MKENKLLAGVLGWLLSVCIAMGGVGCIVTGLQLEPTSMVTVVILCALCTAVCCLCYSAQRGGLVLLGLTVLLGSFFIREGTLVLQVESLLYRISCVYDMAYDCGVIRWSGQYLGDVPIDLGLLLIACLCGGIAAYPLCRKKSAVLAVVLCALPLVSCMVVTDSVPGKGWLFLLMVALLLLIMSNPVRRRSVTEGARLTALLTVPVFLTMTLLFVLVPREGYGTQLVDIQQTVLSWMQGFPFVVEMPDGNLGISFSGESSDRVNLTNVGPKANVTYAVMDVKAEQSTLLYLRGQSFDTYENNTWVASDYTINNPSGFWPDEGILEPAGQVTIHTRALRSFRYMPYYPFEGGYADRIVKGVLTNPNKLRQYTFYRMALRDGAQSSPSDIKYYRYVQLPGNTRVAALEYLQTQLGWYQGQFAAFTNREIAEAIAKLVENSATYSLNTPRMPDDETDFAMWFLQESDTGYCVHFATAATVLLRAANVPAVYVTGYTCETVAGKQVTVTADKAHAWVEYFDEYRGWVVLDPTPGGESGSGINNDNTNQEITMPTRPNLRPTSPTTPTLGTETTEPVETTTLPSETAAPTQPPVTQPTEAETEPTSGGTGGGGAGGGGSGALWKHLKTVLTGLVWLLGAAGVLWAQYLLRRRYRRKQMHSGHPNKRAIARWREAQRMARILQITPPDSLYMLAEKARFSQHTLTAAELMEFDIWIRAQSRELDKQHWLRCLVYRLVWAVE